MTEQFRSGKTKEATASPRDIRDVGQVRAFTRTTLRYFGEQPEFIRVAVEFADTAYYTEGGISNPERLQEIAARRAKRWGLSDEEIERSRQIGVDMLAACRYTVAGQGASPELLTPGARDIIERKRNFLRQRRQQGRQKEKKSGSRGGSAYEESPFATLRGRGTDPHEFLRDGSGRGDSDQWEPKDPWEPRGQKE